MTYPTTNTRILSRDYVDVKALPCASTSMTRRYRVMCRNINLTADFIAHMEELADTLNGYDTKHYQLTHSKKYGAVIRVHGIGNAWLWDLEEKLRAIRKVLYKELAAYDLKEYYGIEKDTNGEYVFNQGSLTQYRSTDPEVILKKAMDYAQLEAINAVTQ